METSSRRKVILVSSEPLDQDIATHVFTGSAATIGVCLTCIGLLQIISKITGINTLSDDLLALDSIFITLFPRKP